MKNIRRFIRNDSGASTLEYVLIVALIAIVVITVLGLAGDDLDKALGLIKDELADTPDKI